ncbi:MAG: PAS domain-containing protein [Rhodospirillaceae bacterium]|nr:PAS domain-containing protein [Rhodospirillaceae bacterium]
MSSQHSGRHLPRDFTLCSVAGEAGTLPAQRFTLLHGQMLAYWERKRGPDRAPRRARVDPADFPRVLPHLMMWAPEAGGDYLCRLCGSDVEEKFGMSLHGVRLMSIPCSLIGETRAEFDAARTRFEPVFVERTMAWAQLPTMFYRHLLLPLLGRGEEVERLLSVLTFHRLDEPSSFHRPDGPPSWP